MHSRFLPGARTLLALALLTAPTAAQALTYEYLFTPERIQTDRQLYLNLVVQDSGVPRATLEPLLPRMRYVTTDLPIVLFLTRASGKPVDSILTLRTRGLSWAQVFRDLGLGYQPLFVDLDRDPGGPYHTVWTSYRSEPTRLRLTDAQIRDLVDLQLGRKWAGMSAYDLARARARGRSVVVAVADKHGRPYRIMNGVPPGHRRVEGGVVVVKEKDKGQGKGHSDGDDKDKSKSKSKSEGEGKGKGKAKGHDTH